MQREATDPPTDPFAGATPEECCRVLLVEDNPGDARLIREYLLDVPGLGSELETVGTLADAVESLRARRVDVVLLDLGLPDASGLRALDVLTRNFPSLPIVVLTGLRDADVGVEALRGGAQDYLEKEGLEPRLLARTLRYAVERKRIQTGDLFLAEASRTLAGSLDVETTIGRVAHLATRGLADYCVVDVGVGGPAMHRLHVAWSGSAIPGVAEALSRMELDRDRPHLAWAAMRTREPVLVQEVTREHLEAMAQSADHLEVLLSLRMRSYIAVPMIARDRLAGVLVMISCARLQDEQDLDVATRLGWIAGFALDNARLYQQAQEAVRTRDRVLGVVAHDLRNPLSTIAMSAELLGDEMLNASQKGSQVQIIRRSAERMDRLIEDLLDVARIENQRLHLRLEHEDPKALVREVTELNTAIAAARSLSVRARPTPRLPPILIDHDRMMQVLSNLVGNAIKFTEPGGEVEIAVEPCEAGVQFSVRDTGSGIEPEDLSHLFEPFWQARRGGSDGAGLGLAIARGIVEAHGGTIWAESEPGRGTTVAFTVPIAQERRAEGRREPDGG
jgi:signal transduction histidine kinase/CheY-like chemotaxis protein